jgi:hypothetical protein
MFLDWLRICLRQGWVGRNGRRVTGYPHRFGGMLSTVADRRQKAGRTGGARKVERTVPRTRGRPPPIQLPRADDDPPF